MLRHSRAGNTQSPSYRWLTQNSLDAFVVSAVEAWQIDERGIFKLASPPLAKSIGGATLTWPTTSNVFEFHFDYRSDENAPMAIRFQRGDQTSNQMIELIVSPSSKGNGGLRSKNGSWLACADPIAETAFIGKAWNQIRISRDRNNLSVFVNEWPLLVEQVDDFGNAIWSIGLVGEHASQRWREVRVCEFQ